MTINISFLAGTPSMIFAVSSMAMFAQPGACIWVIIVTKNKTFKRKATATLAPVFFGGISGPLLYGVTLPKFRPFVAGSLAAKIGAAFAYIFDLSIDVPAGGGLFGIFGYIGITKQALIILAWALTIAFAALFAALTYGEKINVKYKIKNSIIKLVKSLKLESF